MVAIRCACWFGVEVVGMLQFFFLLSHKNVCCHYFWFLNHSGLEFLEHKTGFFCFLSLTEGTEVVVHSIEDDFWEGKDELKFALNEKVGKWDLLSL